MNENFKNILTQFPLLLPETAEALEKRDWLLLDEYLDTILNYLEINKEIEDLPWEQLIEKNPIYFSTEIEDEIWQKYGLAVIAKQMINFLNGQQLTKIFKNLNYFDLKNIYNKILDLIPENSYEEKLQWLEENKPSFYNIYLTLPFNPFINNLIKNNYLKIDEIELERHFNNLNNNLKYELLNYYNAEKNLNFSTKNLLSQEKIIKLTYLTGQILLGFIKPNFVKEEIIKTFNFQENDELIEKIEKYLIEEYFSPNEEEIKNLYIITTDILAKPKIKEEKEIEIPIIQSEEETKTFQKLDLTELIEKEEKEEKEEKPLIINEEKQLTLNEEKTNQDLIKEKKIKNIFSPFKIFNKFNEKIKPEVKVKIEEPEKIVNYNQFNTPLENINNQENKELEEIFIKPNIDLEKNEKIEENQNTINLKNLNG